MLTGLLSGGGLVHVSKEREIEGERGRGEGEGGGGGGEGRQLTKSYLLNVFIA